MINSTKCKHCAVASKGKQKDLSARLTKTGSDYRADLILAVLNDDSCSKMVIWECLHNWNFPMQVSFYVCVSFLSLSLVFFPPSSMRSITSRLHHMLCSSLAFISGLVEFPGRLWKPVRISSPHLSTNPQHSHLHHQAHSIHWAFCCFSFQTVMLPSTKAAGTACLFVPRWRWR